MRSLLTSVLHVLDVRRQAATALPPGKDFFTFSRGLDGLHSQSDGVRKRGSNYPAAGFEPQIFQPVSNCYTTIIITASFFLRVGQRKCLRLKNIQISVSPSQKLRSLSSLKMRLIMQLKYFIYFYTKHTVTLCRQNADYLYVTAIDAKIISGCTKREEFYKCQNMTLVYFTQTLYLFQI